MRRANEVATLFWQSRSEYPPVPFNYKRRYIDLGAVVDYAGDANSVLDLGCGPGHMLTMLREVTSISQYFGYDLSQPYINELISKWGTYKKLVAMAADFMNESLPDTDITLCFGTLLYVFEDDAIFDVVNRLSSRIFIARVPCAESRLEINKHSDEFDGDYAAIYRTVDEYKKIFSSYDEVISTRAYADNIESAYGTKQFFFHCFRK